MAHAFAREIPLALPGVEPGAVYLGVDPTIKMPQGQRGISSFIGCNAIAEDEPLTFVHVMSRPAGGEIRGYVLARGALRLRLPCYTGAWPEMDAAVSAALHAPVTPYRAGENCAAE